MNSNKILEVSDRNHWRAWLSENHAQETEVWLLFYRKTSGKSKISYNDAVEEALCFGWIDSKVKSLDDEKFIQRFSARKKTSTLSQTNIERIRKLIAQKKMTKAGLDAVEGKFKFLNEKEELNFP